MNGADGPVLVTGGFGFIGSSVVRTLIAAEIPVRVLDDDSAGTECYRVVHGVEAIRGNVTDRDTVHQALDGCSAVIHLAARTSLPESISDPEPDFQTNVVGSFLVLDGARQRGIRRIVFASSSAVLDGDRQPLHERQRTSPRSPYGAAKAAVEQYGHAYAASYGMTFVSLRFANCYGPYSWHKSSVIAAFCAAAVRGHPILIHGDGLQTRDFVHVDDVVQAIIGAARGPSERVAGKSFQIGSGTETSILELAEHVRRQAGGMVDIVHDAASRGDVRRSVSDIGLARRHLGYEPRIDLATGIGTTLAWFGATEPVFGRQFEQRHASSGSD